MNRKGIGRNTLICARVGSSDQYREEEEDVILHKHAYHGELPWVPNKVGFVTTVSQKKIQEGKDGYLVHHDESDIALVQEVT